MYNLVSNGEIIIGKTWAIAVPDINVSTFRANPLFNFFFNPVIGNAIPPKLQTSNQSLKYFPVKEVTELKAFLVSNMTLAKLAILL